MNIIPMKLKEELEDLDPLESKMSKEKDYNRPSWDEYFMHLAEESASRSKDKDTKVGACIVKDNRVLSLGYNGAPRYFDDSLIPDGRDSSLPLIEQKNSFICHAELNAVLNYRGNLADLEGASIYVTISPCHECAKIIAQLQLKEVVYLEEYHRKEMVEVSKLIFDQCNVKFRKLEST